MAFSDGTADFRSDTVTRPTEAMRRAMAEAEVGDDVYGEDPTVRRLEERLAEMVGKEAALYVPSGTMGNQIAVNVLTAPGDEVLCVDWSHVRNHEFGAAQMISGVSFRTVPTGRGEISPAEAEAAFAESGTHLPRVSLLVWENTHNVSGGTVLDDDVVAQTTAVARANGAAVHLDGARLFDASVASGVSADVLARHADTVMCCLSKGLGAPVGSVLASDAARIAEARRVRKRLGGAMRQAGVIAAAGLVALENVDRLEDHHRLARRLHDGLSGVFGSIGPRPDTNMVLLRDPAPVDELIGALADAGVLVGLIKPGVARFVTHGDVDDSDVDRVIEVSEKVATR